MNKPDYSSQDTHILHGVLLTLAVLACVALAGCTSLDKAIKVATRTEANAKATQQALNTAHEKVVAANCADEFPVAESEVRPGKETVTESEETQTETVPCKDAEGKQVEYVEVPKVRIVTRTVQRVDTIKVRDRAQERAYQLQQVETQKALTKETEAHTATTEKLQERTEGRNTWMTIAIIEAILLLGFIGWRVFKPF